MIANKEGRKIILRPFRSLHYITCAICNSMKQIKLRRMPCKSFFLFVEIKLVYLITNEVEPKIIRRYSA